jgi:hypothetical protein
MSKIWSEIYIGLPVKLLSDFNEISRHIFEKNTHIKAHENLRSGSGVVLCGRTDRKTDMTELIVAFRSFANAPVNQQFPSAPFTHRFS